MTQHSHVTVADLLDSANASVSLITDRLGFESASIERITIDKVTGEPQLQLYATDSIPGLGGSYKYLSYPFSADAASWPSKRQRELRNLAEKLTELRTSTAEIEDLQVQAFVAELTRPLEELSRLIEDKRQPAPASEPDPF